MPEQDTIGETGRPEKGLPDELPNGKNIRIEALIDYIATTPQNINYNIVREISKAIILGEKHPYFDYYNGKITGEKTEENPFPLNPGREDTNPGDEDVGSGAKN